jgi:hypothetical protein
MSETWRPVVGYEGRYEVSDQGQVRSRDRNVSYVVNGQTRNRFFPGRMLSPQTGTTGGYVHVVLPGLGTVNVQRLVMAAFVGPRPAGLVICHNNGDGADNRLENLRYDTQSENLKDAVTHKTNWQTVKTHCPNGHEYTPENTGPNGSARRCLTCHSARQKARQRRAKALT